MNNAMPPAPIREEDYQAIEAAVMETARGRWFLSEYARRNRNADTNTLLNAIDKLEKTVTREHAPSALMTRIKMDLADMAAAIEKTKREIAQIKHEDNDGAERFERASIELDAIVSQTESATGDILGAAEKIQEFAWTLREMGADEENCNALDMEATNIYMACSFQDLTGQRIRKIVDAMRYVERRINSMIDIWGFEAEGVEIDHMLHKEHDDRPDKHLLNGPALAGEGVDQNCIDDMFSGGDSATEANQDDVDALFGGGDVDINEMDFDAIDVGDEADADDESADQASVDASDASGPSEEDELLAGDVRAVEEADDFVDMSGLDWAEAQKAEAQAEADEGGDAAMVATTSAPDDIDFANADVFARVDVEEGAADLRDRVAEFS